MATHTYNHPCEYRGERTNYRDDFVPLYRASMQGDFKAVKRIIDRDKDLVRCSISERYETPLHVATAAGHSIMLVRYLLDNMEADDLKLQDVDGNTAFCIAAISGNVRVAKIMVECDRNMPTIPGSENMLPLYLAAVHGKHRMVRDLYRYNTPRSDLDLDGVVLKCIQTDIFDVARKILMDKEDLPQDDQHLRDMLQLLAQKRSAFSENKSHGEKGESIFSLISEIRHGIKERAYRSILPIIELHVGELQITKLLLRLLLKRLKRRPREFIDELLMGPIPFIAAKMNNTQFLVELIHEYPDIMWKKNDEGRTIFHIAVAYRHKDVYTLLYEIGSMKDTITPIKDGNGNNILHLVGMNPEKNVDDEDWVSTPFKMHSEFFWYKEVEGILPPACKEERNNEGLKPKQLFINHHKDLVQEGVKSLNETINISMVVAALVCTIGFSVVYSIPGGFGQNNGFPMFLRNKYFTAFLVMAAMSFIFATGSIFSFLLVVLSRCSPHNNDVIFLVRRWVIGQALLLCSVFFALMAFILSFFILYLKSTLTYIIYAVAYSIILMCVAIIWEALKVTSVTSLKPEKDTRRLYKIPTCFD